MALIQGKILGDKALARALAAIPQTLQNQAIRQTLREEAKPVRDLARANVPVERGALKKSIKVRARKTRSRSVIGINIQTGTREELGIDADAPGYYPAAQEFGWRDATTGTHHPGQAYMRPALKSREAGMLGRMQRSLRRSIDTVVARRIKVLARRSG